MLVVLVGASCSGKNTVANYLEKHNDFQRIELKQDESTTTSSCISNHSRDTAKTATTTVHMNNIDDLIDYATIRWTQNMVITNIRESRDITNVLRRPWVLLVAVEAPLLVRWNRYMGKANRNIVGLEEFVQHDDIDFHGVKSEEDSENTLVEKTSSLQLSPSQVIQIPPSTPSNGVISSTNGNGSLTYSRVGLSQIIRQAHIVISNHYDTLEKFHTRLASIDISGIKMKERLRPTWDEYFMVLAGLASLRSNCMKRRVGCVLVSPTYRVISTGYNGTPRGLTNCNEGGCARCNQAGSMGLALDECLCLHAEENALLEAGRERAGAGKGGILYCNTCPCLRCTVKIVQVGVKEVVYSLSYSMDDKAASIFKEAGILLRQIQPFEREL